MEQAEEGQDSTSRVRSRGLLQMGASGLTPDALPTTRAR
jgi:hypothetical protein